LRDLGVEFDEICEFYLQEVKTPVAKEPPRTFEDHYDNDRTPAYSYDNRFESHYETSGFEPNFEETSPSAAAAYNDDPFAALRPETAPSWPINKPQPQHDPFVSSAPPKSPAGFDKDAFGSEPFSARGGGGGAAPNLPPKKPPPPRPGPPKAGPARPPPPRSAPSPVPSASSDAFGGDNSFADFANFENASFTSPWASSSQSSKARPRSQSSQQKSPWGDFSSSSSSFSTSTLPVSSNNSNRHHNGKSKSQSKKHTSNLQTRSTSNLDFTEDPFKHYRYEDPFALSVDPFLNSSSGNSSQNNNNNNSNNNFNNNFDPFK